VLVGAVIAVSRPHAAHLAAILPGHTIQKGEHGARIIEAEPGALSVAARLPDLAKWAVGVRIDAHEEAIGIVRPGAVGEPDMRAVRAHDRGGDLIGNMPLEGTVHRPVHAHRAPLFVRI